MDLFSYVPTPQEMDESLAVSHPSPQPRLLDRKNAIAWLQYKISFYSSKADLGEVMKRRIKQDEIRHHELANIERNYGVLKPIVCTLEGEIPEGKIIYWIGRSTPMLEGSFLANPFAGEDGDRTTLEKRYKGWLWHGMQLNEEGLPNDAGIALEINQISTDLMLGCQIYLYQQPEDWHGELVAQCLVWKAEQRLKEIQSKAAA